MFHVVFHEPKIPPNTGNAIRMVACTGATLHLVEPLGYELSDAHLRRAGLDYHDMARVVVHPDLDAALTAVGQGRVYAFTGQGRTRFSSVAYRPGDVLLFGTETTGLPQAVIDKYPLFQVTRWTALKSGGNHYPPNGYGSRVAPMLGVTHHFKWRSSVRARLLERANSAHPYRGESQQYLAYLDGNDWRLPVRGAFRYSRAELFRRGLLTRPSLLDLAMRRAHVVDVRGGRDRVLEYMKGPAGIASRVASAGHQQVAVCGAGSGALLFLQCLERRSVSVTHLVDRDASAWGRQVQGIPVVGLDTALDAGVRVFVTGSLTYGAEMAEAVRCRAAARGIPVTIYSTADEWQGAAA